MADSAAPRTTRTSRAASTKRRASTVSTDTENKLARAAQSVQRLAQLTDVPRDDSTLDLFPDDPTRELVEAMQIDVRQGTLSGFELPEVVLAAVTATQHDASATVTAEQAKPARRSMRASKAEAVAAEQTDGAQREQVVPATVARGAANEGSEKAAEDEGADAATAARANDTTRGAPRGAPRSEAPAMATLAASTGRHANETAVANDRAATAPGDADPEPSSPDGPAAHAVERSASKDASSASPPTVTQRNASSPAQTLASIANTAAPAPDALRSVLQARQQAMAANGSTTAKPGVSGQRFAAPRTASAPLETVAGNTAHHVSPELDRARTTAFADTVDALYGVIADQRRAAADHSRRMKWMLSIVVGALLATVAIGIAQTLLLMRLTRDTTAQQQRMEQMLMSQQATLATLLDTDSATVAVPQPAALTAARTNATTAPSVGAGGPAQATQHSAATSARHSAKSQHAHKTKASSATH
ncbi:hypothetical protein [Paraburkholderia kururiensis]|uniref:hypothetical protein n=1 Tax=Paraburkholderia kururiensis TaxID=984307 RepID=UPI0039A7844E